MTTCKNPWFQWNSRFPVKRTSETPRNCYVYKGFWRRRRGKLDFRGNMKILEIRWKWQKTQKSWNFAKNARKQKTAEMGKVRLPGNRGPPARPPLPAGRISNPRVRRRYLIKIRQGFAVKHLKSAPFSNIFFNKRQVLKLFLNGEFRFRFSI